MSGPFALHEPARRKAGWRPGVTVRLADGADWHLPRITFATWPDVLADGSIEFAGEYRPWGIPDRDFDRRCRDAIAALVADDADKRRESVALIGLLLATNYDITGEEAAWLVLGGPGGDPGLDEAVGKVGALFDRPGAALVALARTLDGPIGIN